MKKFSYLLIMIGIMLAIGDDPLFEQTLTEFLGIKIFAAIFLIVGICLLIETEDRKKIYPDYCSLNRKT